VARRVGDLPAHDAESVIKLVQEAWVELGLRASVNRIERWLGMRPQWVEYALRSSPATRSRLIRRYRPSTIRKPVYGADGTLVGHRVMGHALVSILEPVAQSRSDSSDSPVSSSEKLRKHPRM
jgi:hypothetical protein